MASNQFITRKGLISLDDISITGSLYVSGTINGKFDSSTGNSISGAFSQDSSSLASRITDLENFETTLDATYATDYELGLVEGRLSNLETKTLLSSSAQIASDISGSFTELSSSIASTYLLNTTDTLDGDLTVTGKITAQEFHTEFVSASIIYESGSTQFGNSADDTHIFSGSISVSNGILGTLSTAAQPNITSLGTLSSLSAAANSNVATFNRTASSGATVSIQVAGSTIGTLGASTDGNGKFDISSVAGGASSDILQISRNGGTPTATFNSSGSVGIGTTSPSYRLDVDNNFRFYNTTQGSLNGYFGCTNTGTITLNFGGTTDPDKGRILYSDNSDLFAFYTSNTERMRIDSSGNLLIGTTTSSPFGKLHLEDGKLYVYGGAIGNTSGDSIEHANIRGARHHLVFREIRTANASDWNSTTFRLQARVDSTNHQSINFVTDSSYLEHIDIYTGNDNFNTRFQQNGNVGIGTTSPSAKLTVNGDINFPYSTTGTSTIGIQQSPSNYYSTTARELLIKGANAEPTGASGQAQQGGNVRISAGLARVNTGLGIRAGDVIIEGGLHHNGVGVTDGAGRIIFETAGTERMRILSNGGLTFNGDTATANALDDYEEGTWTPVISTESGTNYTLGTTTARYTKIGDLVYVEAYIEFTAEGNGTITRISLPYNTIDNKLVLNGFVTSGVTRRSIQLTGYSGNLCLVRFDDGTSYIQYWTSTSGWAPTNYFGFSGVYKTS